MAMVFVRMLINMIQNNNGNLPCSIKMVHFKRATLEYEQKNNFN